jgi:WD40 repeat protein
MLRLSRCYLATFACLWFLTSSVDGRAEPMHFIEGPQGDVAVDSLRGLLYVASDSVYTIDLATNAPNYDNRLCFGRSVDISPNGNQLVAGYGSTITVRDLNSGLNRDFTLDLESYETAVFATVFADDRNILVSTGYRGSGTVPLRRLNVDTGVFSVLGQVQQNAYLDPSGDRSIVGFAGTNNTGGPFGYYDVTTGLAHFGGRAGSSNREIATNQDGTRFALVSVAGVRIFDRTFTQVGMLPGTSLDRYPFDAIYSADGRVLYVSWTGQSGIGIAPKSIVAYDARTLSVLDVIDDTGIYSSRELRSLAISRDGKRLYANQYHHWQYQTGLNIYDTSHLAIPEPYALSLGYASLAALVTATRSSGVKYLLLDARAG